MGFRERLQQKLDDREWTPAHLCAQLADMKCPIGYRTIERWLKGECEPQPAALFALNTLFGCDLAGDTVQEG